MWVRSMNAIALRPQTGLTGYPLDVPLSAGVVILLSLGCIMIYSASTETALQNYGSGQALLWRHLAYLALALLAGLVLLAVPTAILRLVSLPAFALSFLLLVLVLIPGVGAEVNGATRWIRLGPFGSLQGSELIKLATVLFFADYLASRHSDLLSGWRGLLLPLIILGFIALLLLRQPDFGSVLVLCSVVLGMIFLAGVSIFRFFLLTGSCLVIALLLVVQQPYRVQRLVGFSEPWENPYSSGYQLIQALIAFGRGDWWGLGLGNSIQKLHFLPEAHTDFIYSVIAEELGAIGSILVIGLCFVVVWRALVIGYRSLQRDKLFSAFLAYGVGLLLGTQMLVNLGVNLGVLPTKGLTLPFVSYGGNSLVICVAAVAMLLRVDYENRVGKQT